MKKVFFVLAFVAVMALAFCGVSYYTSKYMLAKVSSEYSGVLPPHNGNVAITISALGDCTLGTDPSYGLNGTFDAMYAEQNGNYEYFLSLVKGHLSQDHLTIANLEGPLSDGGAPAEKQFAFRGKPEYVNILTSSSVEAVNLANNHSKDYGEKALNDTKDIMKEMSISAFGRQDIDIVDVKGIKVGLIGTSALNSADRANFDKVFERLKGEKPDIIIANFHWGVEKADLPNADQISLAHKAIDMGADLVLGHHPHVLQGIEKYKGKYIVYSLGNFCFGGNRSPEDTDTMIFKQTFYFKDGKLVADKDRVNVIPCAVSSVKGRNNYQPMPLKDEEFHRVKEKIINRSAGFGGIENVRFTEG